MQVPDERAVSAMLAEVLGPFEAQPVGRRLRTRLRELGANARDEVAQFRLLQKALRESPELAKALHDKGFGDLTAVDPRAPGPVGGALVQAFNRFVETRWRE
jgi:hypothetical protein